MVLLCCVGGKSTAVFFFFLFLLLFHLLIFFVFDRPFFFVDSCLFNVFDAMQTTFLLVGDLAFQYCGDVVVDFFGHFGDTVLSFQHADSFFQFARSFTIHSASCRGGGGRRRRGGGGGRGGRRRTTTVAAADNCFVPMQITSTTRYKFRYKTTGKQPQSIFVGICFEQTL